MLYEHIPTRSNARALLRKAFATSNSVFVEHVKSAGFSFTISCDWSMVISFPGFFNCSSFLRVGNFSGPKYTNVSLSSMVSAVSYEQWAHSSSPRKRNPESLSFRCWILASLSDGAKLVGASSFLFALIFTSLQTSVWASKISLFKDATLPGFKSMGCRRGWSWASVGVCPGWHAAKASLARDVTPLRVRAFASSGDSDTSSALLLHWL